MGEDFVEKQTRRARYLRDRALQKELVEKHLFSDRPEVYHEEYTGRALDGTPPIACGPGLVRETGGEYLDFIQGNRVVGRFDGPDATGMRDKIASESRLNGYMIVEVRDEVDFGGYFRVCCAEQRATDDGSH